jgi:TRAP-type C4-dicarboxylate transport system substrate-binding protein
VNRLIAIAALLTLPLAAHSREVTIKLGTLAPVGSSWHEALKELAERWAQLSDGQVRLKIYAGGTQGGEGDMVRKMGIGQLQAASITAVGMHDLVKEPAALVAPMMFSDEQEFEAVFPKIEAKLAALFQAKGYVPIQWAEVGFVRFFCTKPYRSPAEMADAKVFAWEGDPGALEGWKAVGLQPVVLSSTDLIPSLQTGMINCIANAPLYVLTARLFEKASNMMDLNWAFLFGATLVRKDAWEKIPADLRPKLIAVAQELGKRIDAESRRMNDDAIAAMKRQGLNVVQVDLPAWQRAAAAVYPVIRGNVVPAAFFDEVKRNRDAIRAGGGR